LTTHGTLALVLGVFVSLHAGAALRASLPVQGRTCCGGCCRSPPRLKEPSDEQASDDRRRTAKPAQWLAATAAAMCLAAWGRARRPRPPPPSTTCSIRQRARWNSPSLQAGAQNKGKFTRFPVSFDFAPATSRGSRLEVTVEIGSLDTGDKERDDTLKGDDLFAAAKFPKAHFLATQFAKDRRGLRGPGQAHHPRPDARRARALHLPHRRRAGRHGRLHERQDLHAHWHTHGTSRVKCSRGGEVMLRTDSGEQRLTAGMCAGFPAGSPAATRSSTAAPRRCTLRSATEHRADSVYYTGCGRGPDRSRRRPGQVPALAPPGRCARTCRQRERHTDLVPHLSVASSRPGRREVEPPDGGLAAHVATVAPCSTAVRKVKGTRTSRVCRGW